MKKRIFAFALAMVMTLGLAACGEKTDAPADSNTETPAETPNAPSTAPETNVSSGEKLTIGISVNSTSNEHNQQVFETSIANGEARGHEVISTNAGGVAAQQATDIENLIERGCNVIVIENGEADSLANVVARAKERGIYVISYESGWIDGCDAMFAVNNFSIGAQLYMQSCAKMGFKGNVITLHHNGHPVNRANYYSMKALMEEYTNIHEVNEGYTGWPGATELAYSVVESALMANPDVQAIWASNDLEALGAMQACQATGHTDINIVGYDAEPDVLKVIKEGGQIIATAKTGYEQACETLIEVCEKMCYGEPYNTNYEIECTVITADNVDDFLS